MKPDRFCFNCGSLMREVEFTWDDELDFTLVTECPNANCEIWGITYYYNPEVAYRKYFLENWVRRMGGSEEQIAEAARLDRRDDVEDLD